ncbi:MAG: type II toxin-antitoxin system Phd/YefM family antitoxin [Casimicrobiaceae bacterium]
MKTMSVGEFKRRFSDALDAVQRGDTIVISYGRARDKVAAMVPYAALERERKRPLGLLTGKATVRFAKEFKIEDEAMLSA